MSANQILPAEYELVLAEHRRLVRELDVLLNGEKGAAAQARLVDLVAQVRRDGIIAKTVSVERDLALGAALERAAGELPEGYEVRVEVERGCGTVALYDPDCDRIEEFLGDGLGEQVVNAIEYACARAEDEDGAPD